MPAADGGESRPAPATHILVLRRTTYLTGMGGSMGNKWAGQGRAGQGEDWQISCEGPGCLDGMGLKGGRGQAAGRIQNTGF